MAPTEVFICHRGPDTKRHFSSWLTKELERKMFTCFLDQLSLQPGDPALAAIAAALEEAAVVIVVLSKQFFQSDHCVREVRRSRELGKKVIPLFFDLSPDECKPEILLRERDAPDFGSFDGGESGWNEDVRWIKGIMGRQLKEADGFWGRYIDLTVQDVARALNRPGVDLPNMIPFARNVAFVGREQELAELESVLGADGRVYVSGMGGMGKTQLLLEFVYRHKEQFAKVLWISAGSQSRLANFLALAAHLGVHLEKGGVEVQKENVRRVRGALESAEAPCLMVLDNVDEEAGLWDLLPRHGLCQVLISTRLHDMQNMKRVSLSLLDAAEAVTLLRGQTPGLRDGDLLALANELGHLTLALAVSSRILAQGILPNELLDDLHRREVTVFDEQEDDPVFGTCPRLVPLFDISLNLVRGKAIERGVLTELIFKATSCFARLLGLNQVLGEAAEPSRVAELMLKVGGWFARAPISLELLEFASACLGEIEEGRGGPQAVSLLVQYNLASRNPQDGSVSFHELVRAYGRHLGGQIAGKAVLEALKDKGNAAKHTAHFQNACKQAFPNLQPKLVLKQMEMEALLMSVAVPLIKHYDSVGRYIDAKNLLSSLDVEPFGDLVKVACLQWKGLIFDKCGEHQEAISAFERSLCIKETLRGKDDSFLASTLDNMAIVLMNQGKYEQGLQMLERALRVQESAFGENHPTLAATLGNMANILNKQGKYEQALALYEKELSILKQAVGERDPSVANTYSGIAVVLQNQGKLEQALQLYAKVLHIKETSLGMDHPLLASTLGNAAIILDSQGKYEQSLQLHQRALLIEQRALGSGHPSVASTLVNVANVLRGLHEYERALPLLEFALRIFQTSLGKDHPSVADTLSSIANNLMSLGKNEEALVLQEEALRIQILALGENHPSVARTLGNMAIVLKNEGKNDQALVLHERELSILETTLGDGNPSVARTLGNMSIVLENQGEYEQALELSAKALRIFEASLGVEHPSSLRQRTNLALLLLDLQGRDPAILDGPGASLLRLEA